MNLKIIRYWKMFFAFSYVEGIIFFNTNLCCQRGTDSFWRKTKHQWGKHYIKELLCVSKNACKIYNFFYRSVSSEVKIQLSLHKIQRLNTLSIRHPWGKVTYDKIYDGERLHNYDQIYEVHKHNIFSSCCSIWIICLLLLGTWSHLWYIQRSVDLYFL
jgi:hypothetical protein